MFFNFSSGAGQANADQIHAEARNALINEGLRNGFVLVWFDDAEEDGSMDIRAAVSIMDADRENLRTVGLYLAQLGETIFNRGDELP